jgi:hypothetical protein
LFCLIYSDMRKLLVIAGLISLPLFAAATTFGPEIAIAPPAYALAAGYQQVASVACNDQSCLALWSESDPHRPGLYSSVIDADGTVHPAASNLIRSGIEGSSSLVWTGDHYLAVWNDGATRTLVAAPLSRDGLLTAPSHSLTTFPQELSPNSVAWNGHHGFVVFDAPNGVTAAMVDANGNLVRSFALSAQQPGVHAAAAVAAAGQAFAVLWAARTSAPARLNVYIERFDDSGAPIDPNPIALATNLTVSAVRIGLASNGTQFGAAFVTSDSGSVQRMRIDAGTAAVAALPATSFTSNWSLGIYWSGGDFVAYGADINNIDTDQFTSDAVRVLDVSTRFIAAPQIVQGPSGAVAIWIDSRPSGSEEHILGAMLDRDSTVIRQRVVVARSAVPQTRPALALSPTGALLVWQMGSEEGATSLVATRLDRTGNPIDVTPILVAAGGASENAISVLWLGDSYLVVFPYGGSVVAKRVSAAGAILDADPIVLGKGSYTALASNGTTTILAILDTNFTVRLVRVNAAGAVIDTQTIASNSHIGTHVAAATNGAEFVVAWTEDHGDGFEVVEDDIYAVRLTASGQPMDAAPITIAASSSDDESWPAVASDGRDFLIAHTKKKDVAVKRLLREGAVIDAGSFASSGAIGPRVTFAGGRYFVTWTDLAVARIATVDEKGSVIDPPSVLAQSDSGFPIQMALVPGLVAYSRGNAADAGIPRLFTRQIVFPQLRSRAVRH